MILFIAFVLVAGIASSLLLQTAGKLEITAMHSGEETKNSVATGVKILDINGHVSNNVVDKIAVEITVTPGSHDIDLQHTYLSLSNESNQFVLRLNDTLLKYAHHIANNGLFESLAEGIPGSIWWNSGWRDRKELTLDHTFVTSTLTNFPVPVDISSDTDLAAHAQNDGDDIVFTDSAGVQLSHEIEYYNGATGELQAWVKIPTLSSSTDTIIYLYYNNTGCINQQNPTGVWDSNYKSVWHLKETGTGVAGEYLDSTSNNNDGWGGDGVANSVPSFSASGKVDGANDFDGSLDFINFTDNSLNLGTGNFTVMVWEKSDSTSYPNVGVILSNRPNYNPANWQGVIFSVINTAFLYTIGNSQATSLNGNIDVTDNTWHHIAYTRSGTTLEIYVDGSLDTSTNGAIRDITNGKSMYIAYETRADWYHFDGLLDELSVSNSARSPAWIQTTYRVTEDSAGFLKSIGTVESVDTYDKSIFNLEKNEYGIFVQRDTDGSCSQTNPIINQGDIVFLSIDAGAVFNGLKTRADVTLRIQPETGATTAIQFRSPNMYTNTIVNL
jgi:archaellin